jgi:DNA replication and repair protein RecF
MKLQSLRVENLRLIEQSELDLAPHWNLLTGANGAGKTTLLEAAYLLSHGRSFRTAAREALTRTGSSGYAVFGTIENEGGTERVGIARGSRRLEARLNGENVAIGDLMRHTAVLCFEPGSHELIAGSSDERRRYLDWGVFHVEHDFLGAWRRYQRALKQRNAMLRSDAATASDLEPWDFELARAAEPLALMRRTYFSVLLPLVTPILRDLLGELGEPQLTFDPGFDDTQTLEFALSQRRERDLARGHTSAGPHRADWSIGFAAAPRREHLSRGQEKLCAFAFVLAQARLFAETAGKWPVLCLDDVASEVDAEHQRRILAAVDATDAQVLLTGTEVPSGMAEVRREVARFHVEQGRARRLL